jgi:hypothetical protein
VAVDLRVPEEVAASCTIPGGMAAETCQPWGSAACADARLHPAPAYACVVSRADPNLTACACIGGVKLGAACNREGECEPGMECVLLAGARQCRKICNAELVVGPNPAPCPPGQQCTPFSGSARYGYCH